MATKPRSHEEAAFTLPTLKELEDKGHAGLTAVPFRIGDANSAMRLGEELIGASDPRNAGGAVAF